MQPPRTRGGTRDVTISAQISIYPLRQEHLTPAIEALTRALDAHGLRSEVGPMSTQITGEAGVVFVALRDAFVQAASMGGERQEFRV